MSIPPGSLQLHLDAGDPSSYSGSGTAWNDLTFNNFDYTMVNPIWSATEGGYFTFVSPGDGVPPVNYAYKTVTGALSTQQTDFTMQVWIRVPAGIPPGSLPDGMAVFYNGDAGPGPTYNGYGMSIKWAYYAFTGRIPGIEAPGFGGYYATDPADAFPSDAWTLFTLTIDSSSTLKIYYNDTLMETIPSATLGPRPPDANALCYIGTNNPNPPYPQALNADLAVVRFYDAALDAADIANQYNTEVSRFTPAPSPILHLDAGDPASYIGSGTSWNDLSVNNFDYTMVNPIYSSTEGGFFTFVSPGDGPAPTNYGYKTALGPLTTANTDITMQAWIRVPAQPGGTIDGIAVFTNGNEGPGAGYLMAIQWAYYAFTGRMPGMAIPGTAGYFATDVADAFPLDDWTLFTITVDTTPDMKIYYNDTLMETFSSVSMGTAPSGSAQLYIGTNNASPPYPKAFNGDMAVIRFYDQALDAGTIASQYTTEVTRFSPPPPPVYNGLVGGRQFGQGFNG